jgi:HPt (histidine-containing phosphotransfer) domain-containing protein
MNMQAQLRTLVERHHANFAEQLETVARLLQPADEDSGAVPQARVVEAQAITHQMKGTAGSMGFAQVGAAATALDDSLKLLKRIPDPIQPAQRQASIDLLATLQSVTARTTPETSTLYNADLSQLNRA